MTTGPRTSPSRASAGPQASPTRICGKLVVSVALLGQLEPDQGDGVRLVGDEQQLVTDGLDDPPAVVDDHLQRALLEVVHQPTHLAAAQRPALPRVVDDVGETDAHRRACLALERLLRLLVARVGEQEPGGGRERVPAPHVALQRLHRRRHLVHGRPQLLDVHGVGVDDLGQQAHLPLGETGEAAAQGAHQRRLTLGVDQSDVQQPLGQPECLQIGVGEGRDVAAHGAEAQRAPAQLGLLQRDPDGVGQLVAGQGRLLAQQEDLEEVDELAVVALRHDGSVLGCIQAV